MTVTRHLKWDSVEGQDHLYTFYCNLLGYHSKLEHIPDDIADIVATRGLEDPWIQYEDNRFNALPLPDSIDEFEKWYEHRAEVSLDETHIIFDYMQTHASLEELCLYTHLYTEVYDHFADLVAFSQTGREGIDKLTISENYWDEMGNGDKSKIHINLLRESAEEAKKYLLQKDSHWQKPPMLESLKNANLLLLYSLRRRFIPRLLGGLGIQESTGSQRFAAVFNGMKRHTSNKKLLTYYELHSECDEAHGAEWFDNVLRPLVKKEPNLISEICLGILVHDQLAREHYFAIAKQLPGLQQYIAEKSISIVRLDSMA